MFPGMQAARARILRGGTSTLPVIDIDGTRIGDSTRIIEELERRWPDPPLYPADPAERERALEIEDFLDEHCAHDVRRVIFDPFLREPELMAEASGSNRHRGAGAVGFLYPVVERAVRHKYTVNPDSAERSRETVVAAMDRIERERGPSGYLVGDTFSVADLTAAAILSVLVRPPEFPYHQVDPARDPEDLRLWREGLVDHPAFEYVLQMYARHRGTTAEVAVA